VTRVCGLATFEIDLKEAQRFFAQKFSCEMNQALYAHMNNKRKK
jgi:translation initiation factor 1 (eIF-1/SUI1)